MGKMQRDKGARFERWVANALKHLWPESRRGILQTRSSSEVADVEGTPYWIECKHQKRPNIHAAMAQAYEASLESMLTTSNFKAPVVVSKRDGEPPLVTMTFEHWTKLFPLAGDVGHR